MVISVVSCVINVIPGVISVVPVWHVGHVIYKLVMESLLTNHHVGLSLEIFNSRLTFLVNCFQLHIVFLFI